MHNYKWWLVFNKVCCIFWVIALLSLPVDAVVNVENTRVIFNSEQNSVSLSLANSDKQPTLVQLWVDEGDMTVSPETIKSPIVISPPMFQMKPNEVRAIRLMLASRNGLPSDQEALYWLNIYQIPPTKKLSGDLAQKVALPLRIRMKIYVRPAGVREIQQQDGYQLKFSVKQEKDKTVILIENPTPWYMNLSHIVFSGEKLPNMMILPKSADKIIFPKRLQDNRQLDFNIINDQGNSWSYNIDL